MTNPILPTASLWSLSTWQTRALQRCTAMRWMDSSCRLWLRMFSSSSFTRRYWNSSSSGMLKLHSVRQQFRCTWVKRKQTLGQVATKSQTPPPHVSLLLGTETIFLPDYKYWDSLPSDVVLCFSHAPWFSLQSHKATQLSWAHCFASQFLPACGLSTQLTSSTEIWDVSLHSLNTPFTHNHLTPQSVLGICVSHTPFDHFVHG